MIKKTSVLLALAIPTLIWAVPANPSNLTFSNITSHSINLSWQDNTYDERGYKIYRDDELIDFVKADITHYQDNGLTPNTAYQYIVKASDDFGFTLRGDIDNRAHVALFIDADNNPNTGYSNNGINGADILVQNGEIFTRSSEDKVSWSVWKKVGENSDCFQRGKLCITFDKQQTNGVEIAEDATLQAFNYSDDYTTKQPLSIEKSLFYLKDRPTTNNKAKLFIIGDSTVHNFTIQVDGAYAELGWGDKLGKDMLYPNNLYNEARSGASSKSYKPAFEGGHDWEETKARIRQTDLSNGGYLFMQFGHNDSSEDPNLHTDEGRGESFYNNLKSYIDEAKDMGLIPVLITPVQEQRKGDHFIPGYVDTIRVLAEDEGVLLLDLSQKSYDEFNKYLSNEAIHEKFGYDDYTHFNPKGAKLVADWVNELACQADEKLCSLFKSDNTPASYTLSDSGDLTKYAHFSLFIDADNNPQTGYTNGKIQGADFLLEDSGILYIYPTNATGWKWEQINDTISLTHDTTTIQAEIPASLLWNEKQIKFNAFAATSNWDETVALDTKSATLSTEALKKVTFQESADALKNPLKGFMIWPTDTSSSLEYVSLLKGIVRWKDVEESAEDGVEKIIDYSNKNLFNNMWDKYTEHNYDVPEKNIKVNPIVTLSFNNAPGASFPQDFSVSDHDNQTDVFVQRIEPLVKKLAQAWDNDPRIGFIYMGIMGKWGEQFSKIGEQDILILTPKVVTALGDSFTKHFKNKKVIVRMPKYFDSTYLSTHEHGYRGNYYPNLYRFGLYWDAFAWEVEMNDGLLDTYKVVHDAKLWRDQPILGEVAFNVHYQGIYDQYDYQENLSVEEKTKLAIHETLTKTGPNKDPFDYLSDYIRSVHATALTWISLYNENDAQEAQAAAEMQKLMGYRFILTKASFTDSVQVGGNLSLSLSVKNIGSAPFYYDWPLEVALLDKESKEPVWKAPFKTVDIRTWQSGEDWDFANNYYKDEAKSYVVNESFKLPQTLKEREYILSIAILDPASMKPAVKFAVTNYYKGGRTALGMVGVDVAPHSDLPPFDALQRDPLSY